MTGPINHIRHKTPYVMKYYLVAVISVIFLGQIFLPHINPQVQWHEISVFEKKLCDVINKVCTIKFENLTVFNAFPLTSMETGTKFHVFLSDLTPKQPGDLSFLLHSSM